MASQSPSPVNIEIRIPGSDAASADNSWWQNAPMADAPPSPRGGNGGGQFAGAISKIESGGNYKAVGPATRTGDRALGKYQIMSANVRPWTKEVLGEELTPTQFINSPEAQDAVFNAKFGRYVEKYGPEGAAKAWFAGEGGMNDPARRDVLGTSVADYARKFMGALGPTQANAAPVSDQRPSSALNRQPEPMQVQSQPQQAQSDEWWKAAPVVSQPQATQPQAKPEAAPEPTTTAFGAGMRGATQGVTLGFGDELSAIEKASGVPGFAGHIVALYKKLSGDPEFSKKFDQFLQQERDQNAKAEAEHPGAYIAGNVAGSLVLPMGSVRGATVAARAGNAAKVGGVVGGVSGIGEGTTTEERAAKGAIGAGLGAIAGGVGAPIVEKGIQAATWAAQKPINLVRSAINPNETASRAVGQAYIDAVRADPNAANRLTAGEVARNAPAVTMDALGQPGRNLARSAANISGAANDTLSQTLNPRVEGQVPRIVNWLRSGMNFGDVHATQQTLDQVERVVNRAAYGRAMNSPQAQSVWDGTLQQIVQAPVVQEAIRGATRTSANRAAAEGAGVVRNPFQFDANGVMGMQQGVTPNLRFWDAVKRNLDDTIRTLDRQGANSAAGDARELRAQMLRHLDATVPGYRQARAGASAFFNAENAMEAGQNYVTQNFANAETRRALAQMSPTERALFQDAFVSRLAETLEQIPDRTNVVNKIYNTPASREKIQIALGHQRATELEAMLRVEGIMQRSLSGVTGNSTTVMQLLAAGAAGSTGGGYAGLDPTASGLITAALTAGKKGLDERVANRVAEMLVSGDPEVLRRGVRMLANNNRMMDLLRSADGAAARVSGGQSSISVPGLQLPAAGRADDQPEIPRPPRQ